MAYSKLGSVFSGRTARPPRWACTAIPGAAAADNAQRASYVNCLNIVDASEDQFQSQLDLPRRAGGVAHLSKQAVGENRLWNSERCIVDASEDQFQPQLDLPRRAGGAAHLSKQAVGENRLWNSERWMVEGVEQLTAELERCALADLVFAEQR